MDTIELYVDPERRKLIPKKKRPIVLNDGYVTKMAFDIPDTVAGYSKSDLSWYLTYQGTYGPAIAAELTDYAYTVTQAFTERAEIVSIALHARKSDAGVVWSTMALPVRVECSVPSAHVKAEEEQKTYISLVEEAQAARDEAKAVEARVRDLYPLSNTFAIDGNGDLIMTSAAESVYDFYIDGNGDMHVTA